MGSSTAYRWIPWGANCAEANTAQHAWSMAKEWLDEFGILLDETPDYAPTFLAFTDKADRYAFLLDNWSGRPLIVLVQIDPDGSVDGHDSVESVEVRRA